MTGIEDAAPQQSRASGVAVITNVYSDTNKGGAAITDATVRLATMLVPHSRLVLVTVPRDNAPGASYGRDLEGDVNAEVFRTSGMVSTPGGFRTARSLARALLALIATRGNKGTSPAFKEISQASVVISKGGYLFGHRPLRSMLGLFATAYPLLFAHRVGVPTVVYSSSVGPFSSRLHRWLAGSILRRVSVVAVRDDGSHGRALNLGVDESRLVSMPDCVFGWTPGTSPPLDDFSPTRLCVAVRDTPAIGDLFHRMAALFAELADSGRFDEFEFVVQSGPDRRATQDLVERLRSIGLNALFTDTTYYAPSAMLEVYARSAATISARLHGSIFSLLAGTPALSISIDPKKAEEVMGAVGLSDWVVGADAKEFDRVDDWLKVAATAHTREKVRETVEAAASKVRTAEHLIHKLYEQASAEAAEG